MVLGFEEPPNHASPEMRPSAGNDNRQREVLRQHARALRRDSTGPERALWAALRRRQLAGLRFRRQVPIDCYVVDFLCVEQRLVIEVDGRSHDGRANYDRRRQMRIEALGYRVLRLDNDDVLRDLDAVVEGVLLACGIDPRLPPTVR